MLITISAVRATEAKKWSGKVKTKWSPPAGTFEKSAQHIAETLLRADPKKAASRLSFYRNRGGSNLSEADKAKLEHAQKIIHERTAKE